MKKLWAVIMASIPLFLLMSSFAHADTSVSQVSSSTIINNINSSVTSNDQTSSNCSTDIYTNVNGKVQEYHSGNGNPCSVKMQSSDGSTKIDINNNGQGSSTSVNQAVKGASTVNITKTPSSSVSATPSPKPTKPVKNASASSTPNFIIQLIMYIPEKIFKFLKFW